jgi:hypothetical protein
LGAAGRLCAGRLSQKTKTERLQISITLFVVNLISLNYSAKLQKQITRVTAQALNGQHIARRPPKNLSRKTSSLCLIHCNSFYIFRQVGIFKLFAIFTTPPARREFPSLPKRKRKP